MQKITNDIIEFLSILEDKNIYNNLFEKLNNIDEDKKN